MYLEKVNQSTSVRKWVKKKNGSEDRKDLHPAYGVSLEAEEFRLLLETMAIWSSNIIISIC